MPGFLVAAALSLQISGAVAHHPPPPPEDPDPPEAAGRFRLSAGVLELRHADSAVGEAGLEVHLPWRGPGGVQAVVGLAVTSKVASYGYAGLAFDVPLGAQVRVTPSFAAGLYTPGEGKDLNNPLQFRTGLGLAVRIREGSRLGVEVSHLSSGGLATPNPGVESLVLTWEIPF